MRRLRKHVEHARPAQPVARHGGEISLHGGVAFAFGDLRVAAGEQHGFAGRGRKEDYPLSNGFDEVDTLMMDMSVKF